MSNKKTEIIENSEKKNYTFELQETYLNFLISDPTAYIRCQNILDPKYFHDRLKPAVRYMQKYTDEYRVLPTPEQIKSETNIQLSKIADVQPQHVDWLLDQVQDFCRHRAIELVILEGADLVVEGRYADIETKIRDAMTISLSNDLGTDYYADPKSRMKEMLDRSDIVSTGWTTLDQKLYGGFQKGGLNIFAGGSGSGKSIFLQNLALNWSFMGYDVIYFSLELSENLVSTRLDSMISGYNTKELFKKMDEVDTKVRMKQKTSGSITIKKMSEAGTSANDLRAYLKEYEIQTGRRPTAVLVDYLDLMYPNNKKINPSDMFVKDKFVSEELRALSGEYHLLFATASQLNRGSVEANGEFDHSHIAGGISKINTADNVFGIFTSQSMRERGEYRLQMLKTRSSGSVGQHLELRFDTASLRVMDLTDDDMEQRPKDREALTKDIMARTRGTSVPAPKNDESDDDTTSPPMVKAKPKLGTTVNTQEAQQSMPSASPARASMLDLLKKNRSDR